MTRNTILATKGHTGRLRAAQRNRQVRLPARARDAGAVSRREILALKPMGTTVAVGKLARMACLRQTSLEQRRDLIDGLV